MLEFERGDRVQLISTGDLGKVIWVEKNKASYMKNSAQVVTVYFDSGKKAEYYSEVLQLES